MNSLSHTFCESLLEKEKKRKEMEYTRNTDMEMELSPAKKGMEEIS